MNRQPYFQEVSSVVTEPTVQMVEHAPSWRIKPFIVNYLLTDAEPSAQEMVEIYRWASRAGLENPRVISPRTLLWSSLFQPSAHAAMTQSVEPTGIKTLGFNSPAPSNFSTLSSACLFHLQSTTFLAAVTLSAAIIQKRWSRGTLESKFDRLWQVANSSRLGRGLDTDAMRRDIITMTHSGAPPAEILIELRRMFGTVIAQLARGEPAETVVVERSPRAKDQRFGFVQDLVDRIPGIKAVIAYGSSVSSDNFADIDAVVIVDQPETALRALAGTTPTWAGIELNLGIYSPTEFWNYQTLSGDNLGDYGECIYGSARLPHKPQSTLFARNLSFGVVRQRQQLGMLARAVQEGAPSANDDKRNLHHYFVKIPANVAKGSFGAGGKRLSKQETHGWLRDTTGFDSVAAQRDVMNGSPVLPLARSAIATGDVLDALNLEFDLVTSWSRADD
jgi:hypothetical protein